MTLPDAVERFGRDRHYWRPGYPPKAHVWFHAADNKFYKSDSLFAPFGDLSADDIMARDWHVVAEKGIVDTQEETA